MKGLSCFNNAQRCYDNEKFDIALEYINKAIILNNKNNCYYKLKGEILRMQKKYKSALIQYNKAILLNDKDAESYFLNGVVYYKQNKINLD